MNKKLLFSIILVMLLLTPTTAIADTTVWEIGLFDDLYGVTDGTKITTSDRSVAPTGDVTVDYKDVSTFYSVLVPVTTITGTFDADLSQGAVLLVSWSPGAGATEQFSVTLDGVTMSSKTVTGLVCDSSTSIPDGRCGGVPAYYSGYSGLPYYTETFDFGSLSPGTHTLSISYSVGNGIGFDYLRLSTCSLDDDEDGVNNCEDMCPETDADEPEKGLGTNRWIWNGEEWITKLPKGEGPQKSFTMEDTRGCSCFQILEGMGGKMTGHHKFGCSISVIEDFITSLPPVFVETVYVYSSNVNGADSNIVLESGKTYRFEAIGTWIDNSQPNHYIDAEYTTFNGWTDYLDGTPNWESNQKDLQVNNLFVDWGSYSDVHTYYLDYPGIGSIVNFRVFDGKAKETNIPEPGWYGDNDGSLTVNIYRLP